jgi:hypothetical protein
MHGDILFTVQNLEDLMTQLSNMRELRVAVNIAIVPHSCLDVFVTWPQLRILDFRPAAPLQHATGSMRTVADHSAAYFLALAIHYISFIHTHRPRMLEEDSMFMDSLHYLLAVTSHHSKTRLNLKKMVEDCKSPLNTVQTTAMSDYDDVSDEDMGIAIPTTNKQTRLFGPKPLS